jgi:hypothetical protein
MTDKREPKGLDGEALVKDFKDQLLGTIEMWEACSATKEQAEWLDDLRWQVVDCMEKFGYDSAEDG